MSISAQFNVHAESPEQLHEGLANLVYALGGEYAEEVLVTDASADSGTPFGARIGDVVLVRATVIRTDPRASDGSRLRVRVQFLDGNSASEWIHDSDIADIA